MPSGHHAKTSRPRAANSSGAKSSPSSAFSASALGLLGEEDDEVALGVGGLARRAARRRRPRRARRGGARDDVDVHAEAARRSASRGRGRSRRRPSAFSTTTLPLCSSVLHVRRSPPASSSSRSSAIATRRLAPRLMPRSSATTGFGQRVSRSAPGGARPPRPACGCARRAWRGSARRGRWPSSRP